MNCSMRRWIQKVMNGRSFCAHCPEPIKASGAVYNKGGKVNTWSGRCGRGIIIFMMMALVCQGGRGERWNEWPIFYMSCRSCRIFALPRFNFLWCVLQTIYIIFRIGSKSIISSFRTLSAASDPFKMVLQPQSWCSQIETSWANLCQVEGFLPSILSPNHTPGVQSNRSRISVQSWGQN